MDNIKEFDKLLKNYSKDDVVFGKIEKYILDRINASKEEVINELFSSENLEFVEKQEKSNETRYILFFVYSKRKGRVYVIIFGRELRIITAYPLGRKTLLKYKKKRFIN